MWQIHVDIWQNQYNIVKLKNKNKKIKKIFIEGLKDKKEKSGTIVIITEGQNYSTKVWRGIKGLVELLE